MTRDQRHDLKLTYRLAARQGVRTWGRLDLGISLLAAAQARRLEGSINAARYWLRVARHADPIPLPDRSRA